VHGEPIPLDLKSLTFADRETRASQLAIYTVGQTHTQLVLLVCRDEYNIEQAITGIHVGDKTKTVEHGYVSMTPLRLDLTNEKELAGAKLRHTLDKCLRNDAMRSSF
jgi:broad specificity polyphosphatase/5'/3'-nucleotidase SurE